MNTTLPAEILDTVIDELGSSQDSDRESLNALLTCAFVCRSFHHHAAGHLFANIVIVNRNENYNQVAMGRLEGLSQIVQKNETIGPRILSFSLATNLSRHDFETRPANSIRYGKTLPNILRLLCSIRRFSWTNHLPYVFCEDLGPNLADAIRYLGERTSLKSVSMQCIELNVFPVPSLFKLEHLSIVHVLPPQDWDSSTPSNHQIGDSTCLRELNLHECLEVTPWIANTPALFSRLTTLEVWMRNDSEVLTAWMVMQAASRTLEVLNVSSISHIGCQYSIISKLFEIFC
jgi:hypothetical protein